MEEPYYSSGESSGDAYARSKAMWFYRYTFLLVTMLEDLKLVSLITRLVDWLVPLEPRAHPASASDTAPLLSVWPTRIALSKPCYS